MKKITVLLLLILPVAGFSQAKLVNAIKYLEDFQKHKDQESLTKAKENIDLFLQTPEIKEPAKAQKVKGQVYLAIFENNLRLQTEKLKDIADPNEKTLKAYETTPTTELEVATQAFAAAKTADTKGIYLMDVMNGNTQLLNHYFNKANALYNSKNFDESLLLFEKAYELDETKDTNLLNNIALTALNSKNYEKAKNSYAKMTETKQGGASTYGLLVESYFMLKDTTGGIELLKKGRALYPADGNLLNVETNYFLSKGNSQEALKNLNLVIASRPQQTDLYLARGGIYEKLAAPVDSKGNALPKPANYDEFSKSAEADYKKAVELSEISYKNTPSEQHKKNYFNALYSLGALYFNEGASISKSADKITDNAKFAVENKKANAAFNKAMPYLEKSVELESDPQAMYALKQVYSRLELADKLKTINEKMKK